MMNGGTPFCVDTARGRHRLEPAEIHTALARQGLVNLTHGR